MVVPCIAASLMDQHDLRCIGRSTTGRRGPSLKSGKLGPLTAPLEKDLRLAKRATARRIWALAELDKSGKDVVDLSV